MEKKEGEKRGPGRPRKYPISDTPTQRKAPSDRKPTRVKPSIKKFEEIIRIANNELKNYLRTLDPEMIFASLQGADELVLDKVLSNVTKRTLFKYENLMDTEPFKYSDKEIAKARREMIKPFVNR
jgi:flagellar motor switch protein FliG